MTIDTDTYIRAARRILEGRGSRADYVLCDAYHAADRGRR